MSFKFIIPGATCIFETTFLITLADYPSVEPFMMSLVAIPAVLSELSFTIWLEYKSLSKPSSAVSPSINTSSTTESKHMESKQASKSDLFNQQGWFSWGSPVALGIALMSVGVFFALIALGIRILADTPY